MAFGQQLSTLDNFNWSQPSPEDPLSTEKMDCWKAHNEGIDRYSLIAIGVGAAAGYLTKDKANAIEYGVIGGGLSEMGLINFGPCGVPGPLHVIFAILLASSAAVIANNVQRNKPLFSMD